MKRMNSLEAAILSASPLSKIPKPQIPPQSFAAEPSSVGNCIGMMLSPLLVFPASPLSVLFCCAAFQQKETASVPFLKS